MVLGAEGTCDEWEAKNGKRPPLGIRDAKHWAIDAAGVNLAGTVYSVQGLETRTRGSHNRP